MTVEMFFANFGHLADAPNGVKKLRELILQLAAQGKLVPQDPNDEPASVLLGRIQKEKASKSTARRALFSPVSPDETPYELPQGWQWVHFGAIAQHNAGKTLDKGRNTGQLRDYITTSNLYWGYFDLNNVRKMPIEDGELERCTARNGDLLIVEGGEAGRTAVWTEDYIVCFQNHIHRARFYCDIDPFYIHRFFEKLNLSGEISQYRKGVGISNMSGKSLASIVLPLPPLEEQKRIVAKVDQLMTLCDELETRQKKQQQGRARLNNAALDKLLTAREPDEFADHWQRICTNFDLLYDHPETIAKLRAAILQLAVQGKLVPQDPNDEPAEVLLERVRAEKERLVKEGGIKASKKEVQVSAEEMPFVVPSNWAWTRLSELTEVITKGSSPKWQGVQYVDADKGVLFITSENVGSFGLRLDKKKYVERKFNEIEPRSILRNGDVLMNIVGASIGRTAVYDIEDNANINQAVCLIRFIGQGTLTYLRYFLTFFNTSACISYMFEKQVDNARANLSMGNIAKFAIPLPPLEEQKCIVAKVDQLMTLCDELETKLNQAQHHSEKLMEATVRQFLVA